LGKEVVAKVLGENLRSEVDPRQSAIFDFAEKLTLFPETVTADDSAVLQSAGLSEPAISEGIMVVALFSLITRMADALRFQTPNDLSTGADLLRRFGYRGMAGPWSLFTSDPGIAKTSDDGETNRTLPDSMMRWLESVTLLGAAAHTAATVAARSIVSTVLCNPSDVCEVDVEELKSHGCTEETIFDLILSAAASASLVRLKAGYGALHQPSEQMMIANAGAEIPRSGFINVSSGIGNHPRV